MPGNSSPQCKILYFIVSSIFCINLQYNPHSTHISACNEYAFRLPQFSVQKFLHVGNRILLKNST